MSVTASMGQGVVDETPDSIRPRRVRFEWDDLPAHWIPGDPLTTHTINVLHLLLPAGERWFCDVYRDALPRVTDPVLREQLKGFIGQEATHARAHQAVLDHFDAVGLDTKPFTDKVQRLFDELLGEPTGPAPIREWGFQTRLSIISAIEHFTAVLGAWVLTAEALDGAGADPVMLDLLRWHGAEEVEHRAVAFDVATHLNGRAVRVHRFIQMPITAAFMTGLWISGTRFLLRNDPALAGTGYKVRARDLWRQHRKGLIPFKQVLAAVPRYLRPGYHPSQEGSLAEAQAYLARSPAAQAAAARAAAPATAAEA